MSFRVGATVVCVDASDLPALWAPLRAGELYTIRAVDPVPSEDGNYDKNVHKHARYCIRLYGVTNPIHPVWGVEMGYADSRFELVIDDCLTVDEEEEMEVAA